MIQAPQLLVDLVKASEGFHRVASRRPEITAVPYICPAGFWTIGYGILCEKDHPAITLSQGEQMLAAVLPRYVAAAVRYSPILLTAGERRLTAISDFVFNLGPTRYAGSTLRRCVDASAWRDAQREIRKWVWGGGRRLPGLVARREIDAALLGDPA